MSESPPSQVKQASRVQRVKSELDAARTVLRPRHLQQSLESLTTDLHATVERLSASELRSEALGSTLTELHQHVTAVTDVVHATNVWTMIERATQWAAIAPLGSDLPTISVVMPTHNRADMLRAAVASVLAQSYSRWQLVIIDDNSQDETPEVIAELQDADDRITSQRTTGLGPAGARNTGLGAVTGSIVTFLDDDNLMMPHWLRGIAEFSGRMPGWEGLYGAQLRAPVDPTADATITALFEADFDSARLRRDNHIDLGVLAVRAGHPELHFVPEFDGLEDWDLAVRLSASAPLIALPVLASCYSYSAADRVSTVRNDDAAIEAMRAHFAR